MMSLLFRQCAHTIHKVERFAKVLELVFPAQVMFADYFPSRQFAQQVLNLLALHWRDASAPAAHGHAGAMDCA